MGIVGLLIYIFGFIFVISSLIKLLKIDHWIIRFFDFPQAQFLVLGTAVLICSLIWLDLSYFVDTSFIIVIISVLIYQARLITPYTPFYRKEITSGPGDGDNNIKILVSNVYQPNSCYDKVLNMIEEQDPDVVFLVETNDRWNREMASLEEKYPYTLKEPIDNMYGLLFYSRFEMSEAKIQHIVKDDIPSVKTKLRLKSGLQVLFYGLHPEPPSPTENYRSTERDAELYLVAKEIASLQESIPIIVAGDLNDVAWSKSTRVFQKISRLLDPRKGRGFFNTFHAKYPIRWPLDHFFASDHFQLLDIQTMDYIGSDHFPIFISLSYMPLNGNDSVDELEEDDMEEAERQIAKAELE